MSNISGACRFSWYSVPSSASGLIKPKFLCSPALFNSTRRVLVQFIPTSIILLSSTWSPLRMKSRATFSAWLSMLHVVTTAEKKIGTHGQKGWVLYFYGQSRNSTYNDWNPTGHSLPVWPCIFSAIDRNKCGALGVLDLFWSARLWENEEPTCALLSFDVMSYRKQVSSLYYWNNHCISS